MGVEVWGMIWYGMLPYTSSFLICYFLFLITLTTS